MIANRADGKAPYPSEHPHAAVTMFDRHAGPNDLVRQAFNAAQIDGREPCVRIFAIDAPVALAELLPEDAQVERSVTSDTSVTALVRTPRGGILAVVRQRDAVISVCARTDAIAEQLAEDIQRRIPQSSAVDTVPIRTWHLGPTGRAESRDRRLDAPRWEDISRNYPPTVARQLSSLLSVVRPTHQGKLILWHGEPGTGKTTALRALLRAWEAWCSAQYIADPEQLFARPGYIAEVLTRSPAPQYGPTLTRRGEPEALWRVIIAEDCNEYLRASGRRDAGASLGRVLNLADGVLGQGFSTLILLTTNDELGSVHPAITRPGRCLAQVQFTRFSVQEARTWLSPVKLPKSDAPTLAELFELRGDLVRIGDPADEPDSIGQYL